MMKKNIKPVAVIKTGFKEKFGIPRQSGRAPSSIGEIVFLDKFNDEVAIKRIEEFSHLWLIFGFSENPETDSLTVRPPRLGGNEKVGVFASRSPFRPNGLGLSCVKLLEVKKDNGISLIVSGADLLDGTPVYDIKPYLPSSDRIEDAVGGFADEVKDYKLKVEINEKITKKLPKETLKTFIECLSDDPRPSYHEDGRIYGMVYENFNINFKVLADTLTVLDVEMIDS